MELEPRPGQTDHKMIMQKNPAYEAVNVGATTEYEEVGGGRREWTGEGEGGDKCFNVLPSFVLAPFEHTNCN